jgi:hypothetical protein
MSVCDCQLCCSVREQYYDNEQAGQMSSHHETSLFADCMEDSAQRQQLAACSFFRLLVEIETETLDFFLGC